MADLTDEQEIFDATETTETEAAPSPEVAAPVVEAPVAQTIEQPQPGSQTEQQDRHVPYAALKEEREARKALQAELAELRSAFLRGQQQPQQAQPQQPQQPEPEIWDDPNAFVGTQVQRALDPVQQALMFNAKLVAESRHTPEKVSEAESAFLAAVESRQLDPRDYERVINSPNRFHAAVQWFENRPEAQRARLEAELEGKILAKYGIQPGQAPAGQQPAGAPATPQAPALPSLNRSYGNAGNVQGAISEEDIFNAAPAFGKRKG